MIPKYSLAQQYGAHFVLITTVIGLCFAWLWLQDTAAAALPADPLATPTPIITPAPTTPPNTLRTPVPPAYDTSIIPNPLAQTLQGQQPSHDLITYTVQSGDTPNGIAEQFGIKPETLLGGNAFLSEESSLLRTDVVLTILPIDGVLHRVSLGETIESLSTRYNVPVDEIVAYEPNNLEFPYRLYPNTDILIPGAVRELFVWTPPKLPDRATNSSYWASQSNPYIQGTGTFIWPVSARRITQYYWYGHQAIDIALTEGSAVYATDTGTVTYAGWSVYCFGNLIVINHGNGAETFYAHLSAIDVSVGQIVYQGNYIGASGNTGCSSGPHLHYEIRWDGVRNDPFAWLP
ncbi:MAG TPA: M23 family metallopeptidase [Anaerolineae bacterium]|nr:M23 family metallopeptidase [Anaerolineae bacterium]